MTTGIRTDNDADTQLWNANYMRAMAGNFLLFFSFYLLTPLLPLFLRDVFQADKAMTGIVLSGYTLTALLARPFSGYIVDSFSRKKVLMWCYFLFALFFAGYFITWSLLLFAIIRTVHGAPFGATTVANSTMAIDVLYPERRAEGIGYYGLSNNIAMAIGPSAGLYIYTSLHNFNIIFTLSLATAFLGLALVSSVSTRDRVPIKKENKLSMDRFFLIEGWSEGLTIMMLSFSFGVISTYLAVYSREALGITSGTGTFFALLAAGLIASRIVGGRTLRNGMVVQNAQWGMTLSLFGYLLFVAVPDMWGYYGAAIIIGLGNGHMFPAMQTMFINLAPNSRRGTANSTLLVSWDVGIGLGIVIGGAAAEHLGYAAAFWISFAVNASGVALFWLYTRWSYMRLRLR